MSVEDVPELEVSVATITLVIPFLILGMPPGWIDQSCGELWIDGMPTFKLVVLGY